jgi:hypothetical protein
VVVWIDLRTPGLGYHVTPVHPAVGHGGVEKQAAAAQTTVDFLQQYSDHPRVDLAINTVAFYPLPTLADRLVFLSEPVWQGQDDQWEPHPRSLVLGLLPGRAVIGDAETVRATRPVLAFGSFIDQGIIPRGLAVRDGRAAAFVYKDEPHGRTLAGVSEDGRVLILLVADGYNKGVSVGLSMSDASQVLRAAGAEQGMFLDGGGSTTLVGRGDDGQPLLFNRPAGLLNIPGTLRYNAVHLGFTNLRRSAEPIPALEEWQASRPVVLWAKAITWTRIHPIQTSLYVGVGILGALLLARRWRRRRRSRVQATSSGAVPR